MAGTKTDGMVSRGCLRKRPGRHAGTMRAAALLCCGRLPGHSAQVHTTVSKTISFNPRTTVKSLLLIIMSLSHRDKGQSAEASATLIGRSHRTALRP